MDTLLLASIADSMRLVLWRHTKKGTPQPRPLLDLFFPVEKPEKELQVFRDGAAFDWALSRFITSPTRRGGADRGE